MKTATGLARYRLVRIVRILLKKSRDQCCVYPGDALKKVGEFTNIANNKGPASNNGQPNVVVGETFFYSAIK